MIYLYNIIILRLENTFAKNPRRQRRIPTKTRSRSVPDVMDTKFAAPNGTAH